MQGYCAHKYVTKHLAASWEQAVTEEGRMWKFRNLSLNKKKNHLSKATVENTVTTGHRPSDQAMLGVHPQ